MPKEGNSIMATNKTFSVAGTSRLPNGTVKVRFAKDFVQQDQDPRTKNGHTDLRTDRTWFRRMSKAEICQMLINHPNFQSEEQQGAISEFVVRNCSKDVAEGNPDQDLDTKETANFRID